MGPAGRAASAPPPSSLAEFPFPEVLRSRGPASGASPAEAHAGRSGKSRCEGREKHAPSRASSTGAEVMVARNGMAPPAAMPPANGFCRSQVRTVAQLWRRQGSRRENRSWSVAPNRPSRRKRPPLALKGWPANAPAGAAPGPRMPRIRQIDRGTGAPPLSAKLSTEPSQKPCRPIQPFPRDKNHPPARKEQLGFANARPGNRLRPREARHQESSASRNLLVGARRAQWSRCLFRRGFRLFRRSLRHE